jgi:hypothetical protein
MDIKNELARLEEIRVERLSLYRLLKIWHRLKRHLAARGLPFFKEVSNQALADWSRADVEKLLDLWRTVAVLNECGVAILIASASRKSLRTCWMVWTTVSSDIDQGIQLLETALETADRLRIFPEKIRKFPLLQDTVSGNWADLRNEANLFRQLKAF